MRESDVCPKPGTSLCGFVWLILPFLRSFAKSVVLHLIIFLISLVLDFKFKKRNFEESFLGAGVRNDTWTQRLLGWKESKFRFLWPKRDSSTISGRKRRWLEQDSSSQRWCYETNALPTEPPASKKEEKRASWEWCGSQYCGRILAKSFLRPMHKSSAAGERKTQMTQARFELTTPILWNERIIEGTQNM